jgi:hypothetical protein
MLLNLNSHLLLKSVILVDILLLVSCKSISIPNQTQNPQSALKCVSLEASQPQVDRPIIDIAYVEPGIRTDVVEGIPGLSAELQQQVNSQSSDKGSAWGSWLLEAYVEPNPAFDVGKYVSNPVRIQSEKESNGLLLLYNFWQLPHTARLIFLLDYQQSELGISEKTHDFIELPQMAPGEAFTVGFKLPPLPEGFHQLSVITVADPVSQSTDVLYRVDQRSSFFEYRQDIWVGIDTLPNSINGFEDASIGFPASNRHGGIELIAMPETIVNEPLSELTLNPGEKQCIPLRFFNCGKECRARPDVKQPYSGPFPVKLIAFWNDVMSGVYEFDLPADAPDNLTFNLEIEAPKEPGDYQLMVTAFPLPGYSQFQNDAERTMGPLAAFSRRVLVNVEP